MSKRQKFLIEAVILSLGLLTTQFVDLNLRYWAILGLSILAYFLTAFSLQPDLKKIGFLTNLPLPTFYTTAVALFYFLLPDVLISRILILVFFGIGMYALLLIENIFSISTLRTIQLLRAAQAVGFLMVLVIGFLFFDTLYSFKLPPMINSIIVFLISLSVIFPSLWAVNLEEKISQSVVLYSLVLSFLMAQLGLVISLWPLTINAVSLFLVSALYVFLGIFQSFLSQRLFKTTLWEYLRAGLVILLITFFLASWG